MSSDRQLGWVQRNRRPRREPGRVGELAAGEFEGKEVGAARRLNEMRCAIGAAVDDEFRGHCTLGAMTGRTLTVFVDDASLVQALRVRWLMPIYDALAALPQGPRMTDIRFAPGRGELSFGSL